jgi:hypothetical protein
LEHTHRKFYRTLLWLSSSKSFACARTHTYSIFQDAGGMHISVCTSVQSLRQRIIIIILQRVQSSCNGSEIGEYTTTVSEKRLSKHVPLATGETGCCLSGPRRGVIKKTIEATSQLRSARKAEKRCRYSSFHSWQLVL